MWSTVSLIVLVVFLGAVVEAVPIDDHSPQSHATNTPVRYAKRPDYTYTEGVGAHKIFTYNAEWNTARRTCEEDGAHLVIINSDAEAEAVVRLFNASHTTCSHVGVHDLYKEGEFVTIHGEPLAQTGYNVWRAKNPDNHGGEENCVAIFSDAKLNDITCNSTIQFICELPYVQTQVQEAPQLPTPSVATKNVFIFF